MAKPAMTRLVDPESPVGLDAGTDPARGDGDAPRSRMATDPSVGVFMSVDAGSLVAVGSRETTGPLDGAGGNVGASVALAVGAGRLVTTGAGVGTGGTVRRGVGGRIGAE